MMLRLFKSIRQLSDEELMVLVRKDDDESAFDELYRRYARRLHGFFFRMLGGDAEQAADFTQEVFLRLWSFRERYKVGSAVSPWLFTFAYNLCRNEYRQRALWAEDAMMDDKGVEEPLFEEDYEQRLDDEEFDRALMAELERMTPERRMLFALRFEEELTVRQIAEIMGVAEGTIKSRLHSLVLGLQTKMRKYAAEL